jgi:hypothetical protein
VLTVAAVLGIVPPAGARSLPVKGNVQSYRAATSTLRLLDGFSRNEGDGTLAGDSPDVRWTATGATGQPITWRQDRAGELVFDYEPGGVGNASSSATALQVVDIATDREFTVHAALTGGPHGGGVAVRCGPDAAVRVFTGEILAPWGTITCDVARLKSSNTIGLYRYTWTETCVASACDTTGTNQPVTLAEARLPTNAGKGAHQLGVTVGQDGSYTVAFDGATVLGPLQLPLLLQTPSSSRYDWVGLFADDSSTTFRSFLVMGQPA